MPEENMDGGTPQQAEDTAEPLQKKRCLPEFFKEDSSKLSLDPDLVEAINGAMNKQLSDENIQQFKELNATPDNVNVKINLDAV